MHNAYRYMQFSPSSLRFTELWSSSFSPCPVKSGRARTPHVGWRNSVCLCVSFSWEGKEEERAKEREGKERSEGVCAIDFHWQNSISDRKYWDSLPPTLSFSPSLHEFSLEETLGRARVALAEWECERVWKLVSYREYSSPQCEQQREKRRSNVLASFSSSCYCR